MQLQMNAVLSELTKAKVKGLMCVCSMSFTAKSWLEETSFLKVSVLLLKCIKGTARCAIFLFPTNPVSYIQTTKEQILPPSSNMDFVALELHCCLKIMKDTLRMSYTYADAT